jgi:ATP-dependent Clp protease ATP-binding subunit ClpX
MSTSNKILNNIIKEIDNITLCKEFFAIESLEVKKDVLFQTDTMLPHIISYANKLYKKKHNYKYLRIENIKQKDSLCYVFIDNIKKTKNISDAIISDYFKKCLLESVNAFFCTNDFIESFVEVSRRSLDAIEEKSIIKESSMDGMIDVVFNDIKLLEQEKEKVAKTFKYSLKYENIEIINNLEDEEIIEENDFEHIDKLMELDFLEEAKDKDLDDIKNANIKKTNDIVKKETIKEDENKALEVLEEITNLTPKEIYKKLKEYISGNEDTLKMLSNVVCLHNNSIMDDFEHKLNPLIIGDSGCGKTYSVEKLSKITDLPYLSISAKSITETGWSGANIEDVFANFFKNNTKNIEIINKEVFLKSIVFIDEVDKIKQNYDFKNKDISGEGVQDVLLSYIENGSIPYEKEIYINGTSYSKINTSKCLFIFAGAFNGLEDIVSYRLRIKDKKDIKSLYKNINVNDLIEYGFKKEFAARLSVIATMPPLSKANLIDILKNKKNSIADYYKRVMELQGITINYTDCFYEEVVNLVMATKINARGFKSIFYKLFSDLIYDGISGSNINLNREFVRLTLSDNNHLKII